MEQEKPDAVKGMMLERLRRTGICSTWLGLQMQVNSLGGFPTFACTLRWGVLLDAVYVTADGITAYGSAISHKRGDGELLIKDIESLLP
ncbi:hypothetical protein CRYUN_Cryun05aG0214700 [Craigia yunnanensis]